MDTKGIGGPQACWAALLAPPPSPVSRGGYILPRAVDWLVEWCQIPNLYFPGGPMGRDMDGVLWGIGHMIGLSVSGRGLHGALRILWHCPDAGEYVPIDHLGRIGPDHPAGSLTPLRACPPIDLRGSRLAVAPRPEDGSYSVSAPRPPFTTFD